MSTVAEGAGIAMLLLLAALIIFSTAAISFVRSLCFILSSRDGRRQRALHICRVAARRTFLGFVIVAALGCTWSYWRSAHLRSIITARDCNSERSPDDVYLARYCDLGGGRRVLRLYDREGQHLIAERTYRDTSGVPIRLYWKKGVLNFEEDDDQGAINLPPSFYDRVLAKLP